MTIANYCLIVACALPVVCAAMAKAQSFGKRRRDGGYDNYEPRAWLTQLGGWRGRANAAQANSFEALPLFIAGVLVAQQMGAAQGRVDMLALAFIAARIVYIALYIANQAWLRSAVWAVGMACCVALFFSA